ncbi:MAG: 50S ribosomal protein L11 methyltransferase [Planctomycetota bacterium]
MTLRRFALRGAAADMARALDFLHVHADVRGVEEREGECEVWIEGCLPASAASLSPSGLALDELEVDASMFAHTGLERDAPVLVAPDLCVRPPWVAPPRGFAGIDLVVPRGSAFGSGEHASTQATLQALHACWPTEEVGTCVDVGTGSGILALYARARGARRLVACDVDPGAAAAAAALVADAWVFAGEAAALDERAAVVVANMTAGELAGSLPAIAALWDGRGLLVLGGLRGAEEVDECEGACVRLGLTVGARRFVREAFAALAYAGGSGRPCVR